MKTTVVDAEYSLIEDGRAYCGAKLKHPSKDGRELCHYPAGYNTDHLGIGKCHLHGGVSRSKTTKNSKYNVVGLGDRIADMEERQDYLDLREELAVLRVLAEASLQTDDRKGSAELLLSVAKVADTMNKIETSRDNVLPLAVLDRLLLELNDIANDLLGPYPDIRRQFAERLSKFKVPPRPMLVSR